jgi:magnesium-transporting ATPase (P-type)
MIYSGSQAAKGRAKVICVATGMDTELGKISAALSRKETNKRTGFAATWYKFKVFLGLADTTPLQIKLNKLAYIVLFFACIVAVIVVASTGFQDVPLSIATYAVAAAVSLLPASLPAVIALSLSTASKRLAESNALVRRMDAIETLAAVTDVCSDKTGTITLGKMVTRRVWVPAGIRGTGASADYSTDLAEGQYFTVETASDPFLPRGAVRTDSMGGDKTASAAKSMANHPTRSDDSNDSDEQTLGDGPVCDPNDLPEPLHELTLCAALCSSATIQRIRDEESKEEDLGWEGHGDATEVALQVYAHKLGYGKPHLTSGSSSSGSASPAAQDEDLVYSTRPDKYELLVEVRKFDMHAIDVALIADFAVPFPPR